MSAVYLTNKPPPNLQYICKLTCQKLYAYLILSSYLEFSQMFLGQGILVRVNFWI